MQMNEIVAMKKSKKNMQGHPYIWVLTGLLFSFIFTNEKKFNFLKNGGGVFTPVKTR
jgi:hypothetical protein